MAKNETAIVEIVLKGQQANASLKDIEKSARALSAQLKRLPVDSQEFADKTKEFQNINKRLKAIKDDVNGMSGVFSKIGKEIKGFGLLAVGYLGFDWLKSSVTGIIKSNAELSDSLADIRKTTGMTEAEARKLNTAFSQIDTRTPTKELRNIAIAGGQLDIAKGDILGFTVAVDKMNVALGDEFTGGAEEVTKAMGGLRNIFTDIKTNKVDQDLLHIGNAINELASNGAATGPVVSDFANRIGGVGITLGLTSGQVLGLSATLQELNVSTERGGTAVTKILQKMTTNTEEFAKVAGIPVKEFTELVNKDLYGAFVKVVEGSKKGGASATQFGKILNDLGVDGAGASEVFAKLGSNTSMLNDKVKMANTSLKNTDSIMAEFTMKNTTLAAEMERVSKGLAGAFTNSSISEGLKTMVGWVADLFDNTKKLSDAMAEEQTTVNALMIEIKSANTTNERRKEIYDELKAINPDIVDGIDKENISIQALTKNVNEYNQAQINRIAIQKKQEQIDEANSEAAEKLIKQSEQATKAYELLGKIQNLNTISSIQYKKILDNENLSTAEKIRLVNELALSNEWANGKRNKEAQLIVELSRTAKGLIFAENDYSKAVENSNSLIDEKNSLMKQLGIDSSNAKSEIDYTKLSIEQLNKYIIDSKKSMGNYHAEEAVKSLEELKRRETEKKDTRVGIDDETSKKLIDARKKLLEDLEKLELEFFNRKLTGPEREEKAIFDKYDKVLKIAGKGSKEYKELIFLREQELEVFQKAQIDKYIKAKEEVEKKVEQIVLPAQYKEINAVEEKYRKLIAEADAYGIDSTALLSFLEAEKEAIRNKYSQKEIDANNAKNKKLTEQDKAYQDKRQASFQDYYQAVSGLLGAWNESQRLQASQREDDINAKATKELAMNTRLYNAKVIGQAEYNRRTKKLEEQQRKEVAAVKKKAAENDKKNAIFNALLTGGMAIGRTFADYQYPASLIIAALVGATTALNISNISNQKVPEYAQGGLHASSNPQGVVSKPTYFTNSSSGMDFIAGEKGAEWIAPNWMLQNPVTANTIGMLEAIRQRGYANGGLTTTVPIGETKTSSSNNSNFSNVSYSNADLVNALNNLNGILSSGIMARLSFDQFNKDISSINAAQQSAQVRN